MKELYWMGGCKDDYRDFPKAAVRDLGFQLHQLQINELPRDMKVLSNLGKGVSGVYELRNSTDGAIFRVAYVAKLGEFIVVLHCWQKRTQKTAQSDLKIIIERYKAAREALT